MTPMDASYEVLGVGVHAVQIGDVVERIERWIAQEAHGHFVAVTGMHGVMEAQHDPTFKQVLNAADLVVPDGMPLVWLGRRRGYALERRVYGPELMETFLERTGGRYRHFLYGGTEAVLAALVERLRDRGGVNVVGTYSPPFRPLSAAEDQQVTSLINAARPDVLWVGLSTPKQERWMFSHRARLRVPVALGVGAAFDFLAGLKPQAPKWMQEHGLEWLFRLGSEPRRLWRRYLIHGSQFVFRVALEEFGYAGLRRNV